jgi:hypothetical protein
MSPAEKHEISPRQMKEEAIGEWLCFQFKRLGLTWWRLGCRVFGRPNRMLLIYDVSDFSDSAVLPLMQWRDLLDSLPDNLGDHGFWQHPRIQDDTADVPYYYRFEGFPRDLIVSEEWFENLVISEKIDLIDFDISPLSYVVTEDRWLGEDLADMLLEPLGKRGHYTTREIDPREESAWELPGPCPPKCWDDMEELKNTVLNEAEIQK